MTYGSNGSSNGHDKRLARAPGVNGRAKHSAKSKLTIKRSTFAAGGWNWMLWKRADGFTDAWSIQASGSGGYASAALALNAWRQFQAMVANTKEES